MYIHVVLYLQSSKRVILNVIPMKWWFCVQSAIKWANIYTNKLNTSKYCYFNFLSVTLHLRKCIITPQKERGKKNMHKTVCRELQTGRERRRQRVRCAFRFGMEYVVIISISNTLRFSMNKKHVLLLTMYLCIVHGP